MRPAEVEGTKKSLRELIANLAIPHVDVHELSRSAAAVVHCGVSSLGDLNVLREVTRRCKEADELADKVHVSTDDRLALACRLLPWVSPNQRIRLAELALSSNAQYRGPALGAVGRHRALLPGDLVNELLFAATGHAPGVRPPGQPLPFNGDEDWVLGGLLQDVRDLPDTNWLTQQISRCAADPLRTDEGGAPYRFQGVVRLAVLPWLTLGTPEERARLIDAVFTSGGREDLATLIGAVDCLDEDSRARVVAGVHQMESGEADGCMPSWLLMMNKSDKSEAMGQLAAMSRTLTAEQKQGIAEWVTAHPRDFNALSYSIACKAHGLEVDHQLEIQLLDAALSDASMIKNQLGAIVTIAGRTAGQSSTTVKRLVDVYHGATLKGQGPPPIGPWAEASGCLWPHLSDDRKQAVKDRLVNEREPQARAEGLSGLGRQLDNLEPSAREWLCEQAQRAPLNTDKWLALGFYESILPHLGLLSDAKRRDMLTSLRQIPIEQWARLGREDLLLSTALAHRGMP